MSANRSLRISALALAVLSTAPFAASAQQASGTGVAQLDSIQVTAERRAEDSKDVPVSATVLRPEYLDAISTSASDVRVLAGKVPSLNVESSNGRVFPRFYIRGYGNTDFTTYASQPVSLVYDDVVLENAFLKGFPMFDLAGVEVLRGPQGTQFGRNTPAGVVKFNSVKPAIGSSDGYVNASYGTHATTSLEGAVNIPINDAWAARVSVLQQHRNDWITSQVSGQKLEGYDDTAARVQVLFKPSEDFEALFNAHVRKLNGTARLFRANVFRTGTNQLVDGFDPDKVYIDGFNTQQLTTYGGNLNLTWDLGDIALHAITGYEAIPKYYSRGDVDGGNTTVPPYGPGTIPFASETASGLKDLSQWTQELRVESQYDGPLNWQAGVFYFNDKVEGEEFAYTTPAGRSDDSWDGYNLTRQKNTSWAGFGSINWQASERLNVRAGLRYTYDKKTFDVLAWDYPFSVPTAYPTFPDGRKISDSNVSGDLSATYALNDEVNLYARYARGFRAGSFSAPGQFSATLTAVDPEKVDSYEVGVKADLWDRRARVDFDVYWMSIKDQQLTAVGGSTNSIQLINADKTEAYGAEFNFEALLTENLRVTLGGSYNHTEIKDRDLATASCGSGMCTPTDPVNADGYALLYGNPLPQAAKWIGNATLRYGIPVGNDGEVFFYTDWSYRSEVNFFLYESREFVGQPLLEGGAKIGYTWANGAYEASVFCRNCTDQIRATGAIDFNNLTGFINDPRIVGVQFRAAF
ncbi:TonB-dependent receptor [[Pseudomonas] boreopolis]|uniref:TonB-dependent receptor n=1 Tax=Xanthomonas boreopolis TaxID=86183 RepID=UPI003DA0C669